jgi:hypothetical protein
MKELEKILEYKMNDLEARAYKIALLWERLVEHELPGERYSKMSQKGDPRKSTLFRHCYKLARETNGLLKDYEYKLYITAQIHVLKNIRGSDDIHAMVDCNCLTGDKAWRRWKMWKKHHEQAMLQPRTADEVDTTANESKIVAELNRTREFLHEQFKGHPTVDQYQRLVADLTLVRWLTLGKMSPYYGILSPLLKKALGKTVEEAFMFDFDVFYKSINPSVEKKFEEIFPEEF